MAQAAYKNTIDPKALLSSPETIRKITNKCKYNFSDENEAGECFNYIIDGLKADDYRRLRLYQGKSRPETFLFTTVNRMVVDFRRQRYGRRRIPVQVSNQGNWAERVYALVCWEKFTYDDAFHFISDEKLFSGSYTDYIAGIEPIRTAPCKENPFFQSLDGHKGNPVDIEAATTENPLEQLIAKLDRDYRIAAIGIIKETMATLSDDDQLLVRLVYGSDNKVAAAGRAIGVDNASTARRRLNNLLLQFREALLKNGIGKP